MPITSPTYFILLASLALLIFIYQFQTLPPALQPYLLPFRPLNVVLLGASYLFLASYTLNFVAVLAFVTLGTYLPALQMPSSERRKRHLWLGVGLAVALGSLAYFKYANFFLETVGASPSLQILLPLGISFYTFQSISYLLDVNSGRSEPVKNIVSYSLYMAFFPRLLSGPIERASDLVSQIEAPRPIRLHALEEGLFLILQGLFKKLAFANLVGLAINPYITDLAKGNYQPSGVLWSVMFLFTLQIYFDFAGYMDIGRGSARILGFELSPNFKVPYFAGHPIEFWNRWHITLSTWLRDYLFLPSSRFLLRRIKNRRLVLFLAYMVTMTLSGLWHGAGWNFVLWGMLHGVMLFFARVFLSNKPFDPSSLLAYLRRGLQILIFFLFINLTFVFFMLPVQPALDFIRHLWTFDNMTVYTLDRILILALVLWLIFDLSELLAGSELALMRLPSPLRGGVYALLFAFALMGGLSFSQEFIYGQF